MRYFSTEHFLQSFQSRRLRQRTGRILGETTGPEGLENFWDISS